MIVNGEHYIALLEFSRTRTILFDRTDHHPDIVIGKT